MGRKVHPTGFRLGITKEHKSRWFAMGYDYVNQLGEDREVRAMIHRDAPRAGISLIEIERQPNQVHVIINTAKPGIIIGRKGANVNSLRVNLQELTNKKVKIDVREIDKPEMDAQLVAVNVAEQLERLGKQVRILRCEESKPPANQVHLLELDSATKDACRLMKELGHDDGQFTYRWCQQPGEPRGELLTQIFERMPEINHHSQTEVKPSEEL